MYKALNVIATKLLPRWMYDRLIGRWNSHGLERYASNTVWALVARVTSIAVSFLVTIYLVRYLGPENYGLLSYAISFVGLFSIIASLGIDWVLYRELIAYPERRNEFLGTAFVIKFCTGTIAAILTVFVGYFLTSNDVSLFVIFLLAPTLIFLSFQVVVYEFQANVAQKYTSIVSLVVVLVLNALKVAVILTDKGILYIGAILLLEAILYALFYVVLRVWRYGSLREWRFNKRIAQSLIRDALPYIFIAAFTSLYARVDQIMLKHMMDASAVGLYDAAVRIAEVWIFLPGIIVASLFPAIISAKSTSVTEYRTRLLLLAAFLIGIGLFVIIPATIVAKPLIIFLYGPAFSASVGVLVIYLWSGLFVSLDHVCRSFMLAENKRLLLFSVTAVTAAVNILLNFLFIPLYGIYGAALSTLISYAILTLPLILVYKLK